MDDRDGAFRARMATLGNDRLRAILDAPPDEYTPQARNAAEAELRKRGVSHDKSITNAAPASLKRVSRIDVWRVDPLPPQPATESELSALKSQSREGLAAPCVILGMLIAVFVGAAAKRAEAGVVAGLLVAAIVYYQKSSSQYQTKLQELEESRAAAALREAEELTSRLLKTLKDSEVVLSDVERRQSAASTLLLRARQEFSTTAYAPFWDAVEGCAFELDGIRQDLQMVASHATVYANALKGRLHTFPPLRRTLPVDNGLNAIQVAFKDVVRQGQRNFQFAVIWEHRKTRGAIMEGFRTLGDAVEGISGAIHSTSAGLQATLASGFADVASGYQRAGEKLATSLDRIEVHAADSAAAGRDVREVISRYRLLE